MIPGFIAPDGSPWLLAYVVVPSLESQGEVWFLVDTGADGTCLHPFDAGRLRLPLHSLEYTNSSGGIGGDALYAEHTAAVLFHDTRAGWVPYRVNLQIAQPTDHNGAIPSLLGRDILGQWATVYDPRRGNLRFYR